MMKEKLFEKYYNIYNDTMPILLNKWKLDNSSDNDRYYDRVPLF